MIFKDWYKKHKVKKIFGKYIAKEAIDEIFKNGLVESKMEERQILFFLIHVSQDGNYLEKVKALLEFLPSELVVFEEINQAYIKLSVGMLKPQEVHNLQKIKISIVDELLKSETWFSAIYGISPALVGNVGSNNKMSFCSVLPGFRKILTRLLELKEREIEEI